MVVVTVLTNVAEYPILETNIVTGKRQITTVIKTTEHTGESGCTNVELVSRKVVTYLNVPVSTNTVK